MLKENWRFISRLEKLGDVWIIILSFLVAYYGRDSFLYWNKHLNWGLAFKGETLAPLKDYFLVVLVALLAYIASLQMLGAYNSMRLSSSWQLLRQAITSSILAFLVMSASLFLFKIDISRSLIILFCTIATLGLAAERYVVLAFLRVWRKRGSNFRSVLLVGTGNQSVRLAQSIFLRPELGIRIRGYAEDRKSVV